VHNLFYITGYKEIDEWPERGICGQGHDGEMLSCRKSVGVKVHSKRCLLARSCHRNLTMRPLGGIAVYLIYNKVRLAVVFERVPGVNRGATLDFAE
jgi:hypothetical protein